MANHIQSAERLHAAGYDELERHSSWFLWIGIALMVLGVVALAAATVTTVASLIFYGWLLMIGGVLEVAYAVWRQTWSGFLIDLVIGVLYLVVGFLVVANPAATALGLTLLIAMFLIVGGLMRIVAALATRYPQWGWLALHGAVACVLGILIWQGLPQTALWVIGLFIGIELVLNGFALLMLGIAARKLNTLKP